MHKTLTAFSAAKTQPSFDFPRLERLVAGNPQRATWAHVERDGMSAGLWGCEPGAWRIAFADDNQLKLASRDIILLDKALFAPVIVGAP